MKRLPKFFPINLNLEGQRVLVVGAEGELPEKVRGLRDCGAEITVVWPDEINEELANMPGVTWRREPFDESMLDGIWFVLAQCEDDALDGRIFRACEERNILCNVVDVPKYCRFIYPSRLRRGDFMVTFSSGGASPALARMMRKEMEALYPPDFGTRLDMLQLYRRPIYYDRALPFDQRKEAAEKMAGAMFRLRSGDINELRKEFCRIARDFRGQQALEQSSSTSSATGSTDSVASISSTKSTLSIQSVPPPPPTQTGTITLVGAGPGDPDLITLAGVKALEQADVVVYDRLVAQQILAHAPKADLIYYGKEEGEDHFETQQRIESLMIENAQAGRNVVRLKGGDPFIFGRGGEEMLSARKAGIQVKVIPGITAASGCTAEVGLPLTHRHIASSMAMITGSAATSDCEAPVNLEKLATAVDTLVIYMGVRNSREIAQRLIDAGRPAEEPVALLYAGTTPEARNARTTLAALANGEWAETLASPSLIVIGEVVKLSTQLGTLETYLTEIRRNAY